VYLLYCDESGKSGLRDLSQPFHVLGGLIVHDSNWLAVEGDLNARIDALVPPPRDHKWELHMTDMVNSKGWFEGMPRQTREALCDAALDVIEHYKLDLIMVAIDKAGLTAKYGSPSPPDEIAYRFMIERFEYFLGRRDGEVGVIVSDEQKGEEDTIRRAHSDYRKDGTGYTVASKVIETPFFAPSHWSRMLQLIDVATWICARMLREKRRSEPLPTQWDRVERRLDNYPAHHGRGLKIFP
jgi:Protein of unknown function (DUF3800)